jgi:hypothetical protein
MLYLIGGEYFWPCRLANPPSSSLFADREETHLSMRKLLHSYFGVMRRLLSLSY